MQKYLVRRLLLYVPTLLLASLIIFAIMRYLPGDVALVILGGGGDPQTIDQHALERLRAQLGLNDPLPVQYGKWLWSMLNGKFGGDSLETGEPLRSILARRFPVTLQLGFYTMALALVISIPMGVIAALRQDRWVDYVTRSMAILGLALPNFWVSLLLILGLALYLAWTPPTIYFNVWQDPGQHFQKVIWAAGVQAWGFSAYLSRVTRSTMLEVLRQDYIRTARSKGLGEKVVVFRHALRNALIPVATVAGLQIAHVLSGSLIQENIWGIPGLGQGIVAAARGRDYPVMQSMVMLLVFIMLTVNLLVDFLYAFLDPRISYK